MPEPPAATTGPAASRATGRLWARGLGVTLSHTTLEAALAAETSIAQALRDGIERGYDGELPALPQAVLRFRQGFGRLIRGATERGVFLVLDSRIVHRRYGEAFIEGLPDCEVRRLPASAVAAAVAGWLASPREGPAR